MRHNVPQDYLRFATLEDADRWFKSCEAGKPDWSIPIPPVVLGTDQEGRRCYQPNPAYQNARYEQVYMEAMEASLACANGPRSAPDGHAAGST